MIECRIKEKCAITYIDTYVYCIVDTYGNILNAYFERYSCQKEPGVLKDCTEEDEKVATGDDACGMINSETIFPLVDEATRTQYYKACVSDYCNTKDNEDICTILQAMAEIARDKNEMAAISYLDKTNNRCRK